MAEGGFGMSSLARALPDTRKTSKASGPPSEPPIKLLLWNIHGESYEGIPEARRLLLQEVGKKTNPDIILLQEIKATKTVENFQALMKPRRNYMCKYSGKEPEAGILYDNNRFEFHSVDLASILESNTLVDVEVRKLRQTARSPNSLYKDRVCAIRLRSRESKNDFVVMSFHNISNRTGGQENVQSYAKGFIKLVSLVQRKERVPVVAGADFNIDLSALTTTVRDHGCIMPDYESSERRIGKNKLDLYVINSTSSEIDVLVSVFEALPLVDYKKQQEARSHALGYDSLKYLTDHAPVKNTNERLTYKEYNDVTNHDPTLCTIKSI